MVKTKQPKRAKQPKPLSPQYPAEGVATPDEAAAFLKMCRSTVYELMKKGVIPFTQIGRRRRIPWAALRKIESV